ncbi:hypothetical protein GGI07_005117 [Coemansia sp. Benny D115]|nr:hypothetical protein GGI07_005117 [Coemansia sp. Benny D115]
MDLNARLDQSLDDIIKASRKQDKAKPKPKAKPARTAATKKATARAAAAAATGKPTRRVKNNQVKAIETSSLPSRAGKKGIAARLGTGGVEKGRVGAGKGGILAGRIGKAGGRAEAPVRVADKKKAAAELKKKITKAANISIKGEAGPATIFISNLDSEASAEDVKTCFKQFGTIKSCTLLYDRNGKASGHAEVTFAAKVSAVEAAAKLNNVLADGRTLMVRVMPQTSSASQQQGSQSAGSASSQSAQGRKSGGRKANRRGVSGRMDLD